MFSHDDEDRKKRGNAHAGVDNAMPTDSKWNQISVESNSVSVEASDRFHDNGQSTFLELVMKFEGVFLGILSYARNKQF